MKTLFGLSILFVINGCHSDPYEISELQPTGMFFEDLGPTLYYHDTWKIITTLKLVNSSLLKTYVQESVKGLENLCINKNQFLQLELHRTCETDKNTISHLAHRIQDALEHIELSNHRSKRSLIDAGGKLAKFLFGTMDKEDSDDIYHRITELETSSKNSLDLLQEQTSVIKSNFESLRKPIENLTEELNEVKKFVSEVTALNNQKIAQLEQNNELLLIRMAIQEFTSTVTLQLQEWERQLFSIASIIMSLNTGKLHPSILSYRQVATHLNNISDTQHVHDFLNDPFLLQQLALVSSFHLQDLLFIKIVIPLPRSEIFTLKRLYSLPIHITEHIYGTYEIHDEYLATDEGLNKFIIMQHTDFQMHCETSWLNLTSTVNICKLITPIVTDPSSNCILLLYKGWSEASEICKKLPIHLQHDLIVKLTRPNNWIYVLRLEREIKIQCRNFKTVIRKSGQGIIRLNPGCQAQINNIQLLAENTYDSKVQFEQPDLIPSFPIPQIVKENISLTNHSKLPTLKIITAGAHKTLLREGAESIAQLEKHIKEEQNRKREEKHRIQHTTFLGTAIATGFGLMAIALVTLRFVRKCNCRHKTTARNVRKRSSVSSPRNVALKERIRASNSELTEPSFSKNHITQEPVKQKPNSSIEQESKQQEPIYPIEQEPTNKVIKNESIQLSRLDINLE